MRRKVVWVEARPVIAGSNRARAIQQHPDLELHWWSRRQRFRQIGNPRATLRIRSIFRPRLLVLEVDLASGQTTASACSSWPRFFDNLKRMWSSHCRPFETLATAVAASYMNIPVAHVRG